MATYQAICDIDGPLEDPTDQETAEKDMNNHLKQNPTHTVNIEVTQDED